MPLKDTMTGVPIILLLLFGLVATGVGLSLIWRRMPPKSVRLSNQFIDSILWPLVLAYFGVLSLSSVVVWITYSYLARNSTDAVNILFALPPVILGCGMIPLGAFVIGRAYRGRWNFLLSLLGLAFVYVGFLCLALVVIMSPPGMFVLFTLYLLNIQLPAIIWAPLFPIGQKLVRWSLTLAKGRAFTASIGILFILGGLLSGFFVILLLLHGMRTRHSVLELTEVFFLSPTVLLHNLWPWYIYYPLQTIATLLVGGAMFILFGLRGNQCRELFRVIKQTDGSSAVAHIPWTRLCLELSLLVVGTCMLLSTFILYVGPPISTCHPYIDPLHPSEYHPFGPMLE